MTLLWLKFLHIVGLVVWVAGLLYLPAMLYAHHRVRDQQDFARIRMASRFGYMGIVSPAAFVAIGAGGALLFVADALHPWMFLKLVAVGLLVLAHVRYGFILVHLRENEVRRPGPRAALLAAVVLVASGVILWLVLAKPDVPTDRLPDWLHEPGLLSPPGPDPDPRRTG